MEAKKRKVQANSFTILSYPLLLVGLVEALIGIYNQIQQPDAALGILVYAHKHFGIALKESWYEKLQRWDQALKAYKSRWQADPSSFEALFGVLRCRHALGEWEELNAVCKDIWPSIDGPVRRVIAPVAASSAWGLQDWPQLAEYSRALPADSADASFFQSLLAVKECLGGDGDGLRVFEDIKKCNTLQPSNATKALQLIDSTREIVDAELTALLSESYSRAYK